MPFARTPDRVRIFCQATGAGEPLLLVAGQASDHHAWDFVKDHFEDRHHVIVSDHRGTGRSGRPSQEPYTIAGFARDCIAVLDHFEIEHAHVYGHSMGGRIAQRLAIGHPDRIGAVVLASTTPGNRHGVRRAAAVDDAMRSFGDPEEHSRFVLGQLFTPAFERDRPEVFAAIQRRRLDGALPRRLALLHYAASECHEAWDELPSISAPVLVTHGADDTLNPTANAHLLAERIPGAELHLLEGGRHGHHIEFVEAVSAVVLSFLERHPLPREVARRTAAATAP